MPKLSMIVTVLESYAVVRRQLLHLQRIMPPDCELIVIDDGSEPSLDGVCASVTPTFPFSLHRTCDRRPWTRARARNLGAGLARADTLLFFDIDHILTAEILHECLNYTGDKLHWRRHPGVLDALGNVVTDREVLAAHGFMEDLGDVHGNSFLIRKPLFEVLGGYDERFCGHYGGDDIDFNDRYGRLCAQKRARPEEVKGYGFFYPDPAKTPELFHSLPRQAGTR